MLNIFPRKGCIAEVIHNCDDDDDGLVDHDDDFDNDDDRKGCIAVVIYNHDDDLPKEQRYW